MKSPQIRFPSSQVGESRVLPQEGAGGRVLALVLVLAWAAGTSPASAQSDGAVRISMGTHALTVPWYPKPIASGFNPTFLVGADRFLNTSRKWTFYWALNLGFFRHRWWMSGVSLEPEIGIGRTLAGGFQADLRLGLGYLHYFWRRESLELREGHYAKMKDRGRPSIILPLSLTVGYPGTRDDPLSVSPFITARWGIQGLFLEGIPAMTHLHLLGGVRIDQDHDPQAGGR